VTCIGAIPGRAEGRKRICIAQPATEIVLDQSVGALSGVSDGPMAPARAWPKQCGNGDTQ